jgi:hypothetical protein
VARSSITFGAIPDEYPPHPVSEANEYRDGKEYTDMSSTLPIGTYGRLSCATLGAPISSRLLGNFSAYVTKWLKPSDCCGFLAPQGMPQLPILLQSKPKIRRHP